jgi:hypothetical protein
MAITSGLDAIWGRCEAYAGAAGFGPFIRARARQPEAFYKLLHVQLHGSALARRVLQRSSAQTAKKNSVVVAPLRRGSVSFAPLRGA